MLSGRQLQPILLLIANQNAAGKAVINLGSCSFVRMRVVNMKAGSIQYLKFKDTFLPFSNSIHWMSILLCRNMKPMPMHNRLF